MTEWIVAYCKMRECGWVEARVKEDRFTTTDVTDEMVEHTAETGHHCRQEPHYR